LDDLENLLLVMLPGIILRNLLAWSVWALSKYCITERKKL